MTQDTSLTELETSILMTLTCADALDQPRTLAELHAGLFTPREVTIEEVADALDASPILPKLVQRRGDYWSLEGRSALIPERLRREVRMRAALAARMLPTACLLALPIVETAYVSDIGAELTVVAKPGFAWTVWWAARLLALPVRRVLERDRQELKECDVFTARGLVSVRPLLSGHDTEALRAANGWAREFCANAFSGDLRPAPPATRMERLLAGFMSPFERILEGLAGRAYGSFSAESAEMTAEFDVAWRRQLAKASAMADYLKANAGSHGRSASY